MANTSYARPLLIVGFVGLAGTCFLAATLDRPATASAEAAPRPVEAISKPVPTPPVVAPPPVPAAAPTPAAVPVMDAGREAACQAEFDKVVQESPIDFLRDRNDLTLKSKAVLDELVVVSRACSGLKVEIQGHTDSQGKRQNNIRLSRKRADAVKKYLVEQGLSPDQLTAVGFGPDRPAASNRTAAGRTKNRRIEFRLSRVELE